MWNAQEDPWYQRRRLPTHPLQVSMMREDREGGLDHVKAMVQMFDAADSTQLFGPELIDRVRTAVRSSSHGWQPPTFHFWHNGPLI